MNSPNIKYLRETAEKAGEVLDSLDIKELRNTALDAIPGITHTLTPRILGNE